MLQFHSKKKTRGGKKSSGRLILILGRLRMCDSSKNGFKTTLYALYDISNRELHHLGFLPSIQSFLFVKESHETPMEKVSNKTTSQKGFSLFLRQTTCLPNNQRSLSSLSDKKVNKRLLVVLNHYHVNIK